MEYPEESNFVALTYFCSVSLHYRNERTSWFPVLRAVYGGLLGCCFRILDDFASCHCSIGMLLYFCSSCRGLIVRVSGHCVYALLHHTLRRLCGSHKQSRCRLFAESYRTSTHQSRDRYPVSLVLAATPVPLDLAFAFANWRLKKPSLSWVWSF